MATERIPHADELPVTIRLLSNEETQRASISDTTTVAHQGSTEEFFSFLDTLPTSDDPSNGNDADPR